MLSLVRRQCRRLALYLTFGAHSSTDGRTDERVSIPLDVKVKRRQGGNWGGLGAVPDGVVRPEPDPVRDRAVLLGLAAKDLLHLERLVRRL